MEQLLRLIDKGCDIRYGTQSLRNGMETDFFPSNLAVTAENM